MTSTIAIVSRKSLQSYANNQADYRHSRHRKELKNKEIFKEVLKDPSKVNNQSEVAKVKNVTTRNEGKLLILSIYNLEPLKQRDVIAKTIEDSSAAIRLQNSQILKTDNPVNGLKIKKKVRKSKQKAKVLSDPIYLFGCMLKRS